MLKHIFKEIEWKTSNDTNTLILLDKTFGESVKWYDNINGEKDLILDQNFRIFDLDRIKEIHDLNKMNIGKILVLVNLFDENHLKSLSALSMANDLEECIILSNMSSNELLLWWDRENSSKNPYQEIMQVLNSHMKTQILYFPFHSITITPTQELEPQVEIKIISSHCHRKIKPLTLKSIGIAKDNSSEYKSINDLNGVDLPPEVRTQLKSLAYEIAGSCVFDLNIDPRSSIFSLGKTSSLLGHNVMTIIDELLKQKAVKENIGINIRDNLNDFKNRNSNQSASLIIIDRFEDLLTPSFSSGVQSLAQRSMNALKIPKENEPNSCLIDITIESDLIREVKNCFLTGKTSSSEDASNHLLKPMSGMANLSFQTLPSICYNSVEEKKFQHHGRNSTLLYSIMTGSEEEGKVELCNEFKLRIQQEKGKFPPEKKRGLGAEILAYSQALIQSKGFDNMDEESKKENPMVSYRSESLLSISSLLIETMQRSSHKQFYSICNWKSCHDLRVQRETEILQEIHRFPEISLMIAKVFQHIQSLSRKQEPFDLVHAFLISFGMIWAYKFRESSSEVTRIMAFQIFEYLLEASWEELSSFKSMNIFDLQLIQSILEYKELKSKNDEDLNLQMLQEDIMMLIFQILQPIDELITMNYQQIEVWKKKKIFEQSEKLYSLFDHPNNLDSKKEVECMLSKGLIAKIVEDCIRYKLSEPSLNLPNILEHIESPLEQMARKGLGLLNKGLGKLGFMSSSDNANSLLSQVAHPGSNEILVIFVVGGISYKEACQVQKLLHQEYQSLHKYRIILVSNSLISSDDIVPLVLGSTY